MLTQQGFEHVGDLSLIPSESHNVNFKTLAVKLIDSICRLSFDQNTVLLKEWESVKNNRFKLDGIYSVTPQ